MHRKLALAGVAGALLGTSLIAAPASQAAARDGVCNAGEFCLYFNSNHKGSVSDFKTSISNYGDRQPTCYEFRGRGNGRGKCVKNEAASVWNRTSKPVTVFFNSGYQGASQRIPARGKVNLNATLKNQNASHRIGGGGGGTGGGGGGGSTTGKRKMTTVLYGGAGGTLTAGFDGYRNTPGRHEGIDFAKGFGVPVHALVAGEVTNVVIGATRSLSTIAIYNRKLNKTVIYLHTAPTIRKGATVKVGQKIATESNRAGGATHTHVEMRPGRQTNASKSVDDPKLDNPNPTTFWQGLGYIIG
ncbi:peptidase inhibitor family I36 protein [Patulibacter brassicae]|jgi:hypothetical protein|uniref:Peptidase inhibitor family I36 protein n=1 Tax=Patulibacter brassicae TaxID=1705717 RepID=A0ABU4VHD1_9ACTN|nr:peptidase inhibitor family I36 protein [Patulibacter brassicae]MDX8151227.1 peptidase inhibitor family I36 protein [Patulibacter brassicae]